MSAFSEFLAGRVLELEKELVAARRRECELRKSRDLWRMHALDKSKREAARTREAELRESRDLWRERALKKSRKNQPAAAGPGLGSETGGRKEVTV